MKALSIQQPWAWLIIHGFKAIENRSWISHFRGEFLIHAGIKVDRDAYGFVREMLPNVEVPVPTSIEKGGIVGIAEMTGCINSSDSVWFFGPYGFTIENARSLPFRSLPGKLGFFEVACG